MEFVAEVLYGRLLLDLLHAIVTDDPNLFVGLLELPFEQRLKHLVPDGAVPGDSSYTNYFCFCESETSVILHVVVFDHEILRRVAEAYGLTDFVFFGCNGDPVVPCTAATIVKKLIDVKGKKKMSWGGNWDRAVPVPGKVSAELDRVLAIKPDRRLTATQHEGDGAHERGGVIV